ncbi:YchJ family protein [Desulfosarcina sp. OttesenSCG-928-A07]|nr:YchJ family protein [Desulfosarcina sp. OttesenSCG-928-G17]MDL2329749.1 YchJ family protein [Desulfosarcina sp. OttesenSCG-928-A07]
MELCPCGSKKPYAECCGPLISGESFADTAEALMRARYTAHAKKIFDYVAETTLPENRQEKDVEETEVWSRKLDWQWLEIRRVEAGGPEDVIGTVEFVARYRKNGTAFDHLEQAEFVKQDGRWYFKDGMPPPPVQMVRQGPKLGRNDPCSCGSGKKFKKCCGT